MMVTRRGFLRDSTLLGGAVLCSSVAPRLAFAQDTAEVRIGTLCPLTGGGSVFGQGMQKAMEFAAADVNALGGVLGGRKLRLYSEDAATDPAAAVRAVHKLIDINETETVLGTWSSGVTMAIAPIVMESGVVNMNTSGTTDLVEMEKDEWIWPCAGSNITYGIMMARHALQQGYTKASFLAFNNPSGRTLGEEFKQHFEAAGGTCNVIVYNPNQPSYRAELTRALSTDPEVIALGSYLPDTTILIKEWYAMGVPINWIGPFWAVSPALIEAVGARAAEGIVSIGPVPNAGSASYDSFRTRYEEATGQDLMANPFAGMAYDMLATTALAIEAAKSSVAAEFRQKIRGVASPGGRKVSLLEEALAAAGAGEDIDYEGVGGNMNFNERGVAEPYFAWWVAHDGALELVGRIEI